MLANSVVIK